MGKYNGFRGEIDMHWTRKFSKAHIIIIVTGILAFTSTFAYLNSLDKKIMVAKLKSDVIAGQVLTSKDVNFVPISNDDETSGLFITQSSIKKNAVVARLDMEKSDFLTTSNTSRRSTKAGLQSLSITLEAGKANGGDIISGDRVDIYQTGDEARLVAKDLEVRSIIKPSERLGISTSKDITIVIAVSAQQASELSKIIGSNDVMMVLSTGSTEVTKPKKNSSPTTIAPELSTTTIPAVGPDGFSPIDLGDGG